MRNRSLIHVKDGWEVLNFFIKRTYKKIKKYKKLPVIPV